MSPKPKNGKAQKVAPDIAGFVVRTARLVPPTEWSETYIQGMIDRMSMSFFKYGAVSVAYPEHVDALKSLLVRLMKYCGKVRLETALATAARELGAKYAEEGDHNLEWLMDVGNFAMIEFMRPSYPNATFVPTDSNASPGRISTQSGHASWRDNKSV